MISPRLQHTEHMPAQPSPVRRYFDVCERLDEARLTENGSRVRLLSYAVDILAAEAREALHKERTAPVEELFDMLGLILAAPFPSIRPRP